MKRTIAYCIDKSYVMPLAVSIRSVLEKWDQAIVLEIYVLHCGLSAEEVQMVCESQPDAPFLTLRWIDIDKAPVQGLATGLHFSEANYFRLLLADMLDADSVLYLDADTVSLADLSELFCLYDENWAAQACQEFTGTFSNEIVNFKDSLAHGIPPDSMYFNSGVMLLNLRLWRQEKLAEKILHFARTFERSLFLAEQTPLNAILYGRIGKLSGEWNCQTVHPNLLNGVWNFPFLKQEIESAKIVHYTTEYKPWSLGRDLPGARFFQEVLQRTKFS